MFHPVLGGRFAVGVTGLFGNVNTSVAGTLTASLGPLVAMRSGLISDELTGSRRSLSDGDTEVEQRRQ